MKTFTIRYESDDDLRPAIDELNAAHEREGWITPCQVIIASMLLLLERGDDHMVIGKCQKHTAERN